MELIWREPALEQFETILAYIAERNEGAANRLQPAHPFLYRPGQMTGMGLAMSGATNPYGTLYENGF